MSRPILAEVAAQIADVQVRNRGTIGGNVCSNDPTNHLPPLLVALGASMTIRGEDGERDVPAEEFFLGVYMTAVGEGELLHSDLGARRRECRRRLRVDHDRRGRNLPGERGRQPRRRLGAIALGCVDAVPVLLTPTSSDEESVRAGGRGRRASSRRPTCTPPPTTGVTWPASARCAPSSSARERGK